MGADPSSLLRSARSAAGLSQAELGARAGTSQSAVAAYESGTRRPTIGVLERLLAAAGHSLELEAQPQPAVPTLAAVRRAHAPITQVARTYGARSVRVIGSVARGDARPGSDIDLLVDFRPGTTLLHVIGMEGALEEVLGHPVHITSTGAARGRLAHVEDEAVAL